MEKLLERVAGKVYIVMSEPPGPESQFIEAEDHEGKGLKLGRWVILPPRRYRVGEFQHENTVYALELDPSRDDVVKFLWQLLDDIDTLDDACRSDNAAFRQHVRAVLKRRWETGIETDGYTLDLTGAKAP